MLPGFAQFFEQEQSAPLPYDAEVEWIANASSTTGPYIKTGYIPLNNAGDVTFDMKVRQNIAFTSDVGLIGARSNFAARTCWALPLAQNGTGYQFGYGSIYFNLDSQQSIVSKDVRIWTTISNGNMISNFDDGSSVDTYSTPKQSFACGCDIWLFATNNFNSPLFGNTAMFYGRIYYCKIYENGTLVRDFIPVRKGGVGYMYDRVSKKLFGNKGTGDFVVGPDIVEVEYIGVGSSVGPYIDTGYAWTTDNIKIDIEFMRTGTPNANTGLFGSQKIGQDTNWGIQFGQPNIFGVHHYIGSSPSVYSWFPSTGQKIHFVGEATASHTWAITIDGVEHTGTWSGTVCQDVTTVGLFTIYNNLNMTARRTNNVNVYSFKLMDDGVLVRDFVPVRVGMEGAMMDRLTRKIYRNAGTGAFLWAEKQ